MDQSTNWLQMTLPDDVKSIVMNELCLELWKEPPKQKSKESEDIDLQEIVNDYLTRTIITETKGEEEYQSPFFGIHQNNKLRPILDLRTLNRFTRNSTFRMEGMKEAKKLIHPNCFLAKIDLSDAYLSIPVNTNFQKYLCFSYQGKTYKFQRMPFGLNIAPRIFTRIMKTALKPMREAGFNFVTYLDDILIIANTKSTAEQQALAISNHLESLGFLVNMKKSIFQATNQLEFLGNTIDTSTMTVSIPYSKCQKIIQDLKSIIKFPSFPIRKLAAISGMIASTYESMEGHLIHQRYLQANISMYIKKHANWNQQIPIFNNTKQEAKILMEIIKSNRGLNIIWNEKPIIHLFTDASRTGFGFHTTNMNSMGLWTFQESAMSSNFRELKTVLIALRKNSKKWKFKRLIVHSDNTTTVSQINRQSNPRHAHLLKITKLIFRIAYQNQIDIRAEHIRGIENIQADFLSRACNDPKEWSLSSKATSQITKRFGKIQFDLFATPQNAKASKFASRIQWPKSSATDAFQMRLWPGNSLLNPPIGLLSRCLQKARILRSQSLIVVTPNWPTQPWFPVLLNHSIRKPLKLSYKIAVAKKNRTTRLPFNKILVWKVSFNQKQKNST